MAIRFIHHRRTTFSLKARKNLYDQLEQRRSSFGTADNYTGLSKGYYRVAVKNHQDNQQLIRALRELQNMIFLHDFSMKYNLHTQGEEHILAKALWCRVPCPMQEKKPSGSRALQNFQAGWISGGTLKSQNMASEFLYHTKEGLEMGRAQVMQAEAAGLHPSVLMYPIL